MNKAYNKYVYTEKPYTQMSKAFKERVDKLFEATRNLSGIEAYIPHCEDFNSWVAQQDYALNTIATYSSKYGLYSKFAELDLIPCQNATWVREHGPNYSVTGARLIHYVPLFCGLSEQDWQDRNGWISPRQRDRLRALQMEKDLPDIDSTIRFLLDNVQA